MAGLFGSNYNDTKAMMDDLSNITEMYSKAAPSNDESIMKAPKSDNVDAGSWWAWLSGLTRQKTQENLKRVQEELGGMDLSGTSPEYQRSMLEGIKQAQAYRDKWNITQSRTGQNVWLEEQGDFTIPEQSEITVEPLDSEPMTSMDQSLMSPAGEPSPEMSSFGEEPVQDPVVRGGIMRPPEEPTTLDIGETADVEQVTTAVNTAAKKVEAPLFTDSDTLARGSSNEVAVRELQTALVNSMDLPASFSIDGDYGPATEAAIKAYQTQNNIPDTGKFDSKTYDTMVRKGDIVPQEANDPHKLGMKIDVKETTTEPKTFTENSSLGTVTGKTKTYDVNGESLDIIDIFETTKTLPEWKNNSKITPKNIVLHHTDVIYNEGQKVKHFLNGFSSHKNVTVQYFIDKSGKVYQVMDPTSKGAHTGGKHNVNKNLVNNSNSIGIEVEATQKDLANEKQLEASRKLVDYLIGSHNTIKTVLAHPQSSTGKGHYEGWDVYNYWRKSHNMPEIEYSMDKEKNIYKGPVGPSFKAAGPKG